MLKDDEFSPEIKSAIEGLVCKIRSEFPDERGQRRATEKVLIRLRRTLRPQGRGGRPAAECVTKALSLLENGMKWCRIYPLAIPGHEASAGRKLLQDNLRKAVRARLRRQQKKEFVAPTNALPSTFAL